jgi:hypothetical protein
VVTGIVKAVDAPAGVMDISCPTAQGAGPPMSRAVILNDTAP